MVMFYPLLVLLPDTQRWFGICSVEVNASQFASVRSEASKLVSDVDDQTAVKVFATFESVLSASGVETGSSAKFEAT